MSNPFYPDTLNTPTCNVLNRQWRGTLPQLWQDCKDNNKKHPEQKVDCCDTVMQCKNPNEWFTTNNISASCVVKGSPDQPHFGDVQMSLSHAHKVKKKLSFGVY